MDEADGIVIEALLDDVLDQQMLDEAIEEACRLLRGDEAPDRLAAVESKLAAVTEQCARLIAAITAGGALTGLLAALQAREAEKRR